MESYLKENFGGVKAKHSSDEALGRWRNVVGVVKNPTRRFRFTANLDKRSEAAAMKRSNQEKLRVAVLVSKAALQFIHAMSHIADYTVPADVAAAGFGVCAEEMSSVVESHDIKRLKTHGGVEGVLSKLSTSASDGLPASADKLAARQELFGVNRFAEAAARSFWVFVWEALQDMTLMILAACALVSLLVGIATEGWPHGAHDGLGIDAMGQAATLSEGGDDETPLQVKLNGVATIIGKIGLIFAVVTFAVLTQSLFWRKISDGSYFSWTGDDALELLEFFAIAVTIVVVAVPEGLPLAVTLSLAFAMKKMMNDKALVRYLAACETMGSATSICSDKTGTLTTNHMTVVKACICGKVKDVSSSSETKTLPTELPSSVVAMLLQSIFNNTGGDVVMNQDGKREILGTPTETAILEFGLSLGGDFSAVRKASTLVKVEPFNSAKKRMGVVIQLPGGALRAHCKGASEIILASCTKYLDEHGNVVPLDGATLDHLKATIDSFANEALRTLCLAYIDVDGGFSASDQIPMGGYTCIGIVGIKDPVRPGVKESVAICSSAGITVRMVTGDNINTAKAIAWECGILTEGGVAIEGPDFRVKGEEELHELIPKIQVMARSSPLDKHTLVKHLRTTFDEVVAVTGDGTNDAPALHEADIGLAMGIAGTEVAKESADVIILDDNFSTIVTVAKWGRSVYINIQKFVQFQLTVNAVALIVNFSSACLIGSAPLTAVQLLWVNMIMDTLGALALATEPPNNELMKRTSVGRKGNFISNVMWRNIMGQAIYQFLVIWYLHAEGKWLFGIEGDNSDLVLNTIIFNCFVVCQIFNEVSSREMERINVFEGISDNNVFAAVLGSTVVFQLIIIQFLGNFANTTPLTFTQWIASIFIGFIGMPITVVVKMVPVDSA
ncbi:calcium-transporting ATPase 2, plasma membrane-type [Panicum miliaceum]|uniref:Calcium-transporting ATPase n=1 Tax=Panicum miliaceum TaxID=4540 RepID=A0A3L6PR13_PANMI|nr:calcium-transporting ATPase 2, plasma membrane-type [Panicum miliaceum]